MKTTRAGVDQLANLFREILANSRKLVKLLVVHPRDRIGPRGDGVGGGSVRADLERVFAFDLEQVGDFGKDLRDWPVIHA